MKIIAEVVNRGPLTPQEAVVLRHLCEGRMRKEIARSMYRSYGCVSKQVESIALKLDAHSAAEIVAKAVAQGLVEIKIVPSSHHSLLTPLLIFLCLVSHQAIDIRQPPRQGRQSVRLMRLRSENQTIGAQPWT